jgi:hypothetical protein
MVWQSDIDQLQSEFQALGDALVGLVFHPPHRMDNCVPFFNL